MMDEWFLYRVSASIWKYFIVQEDEIMLRLTGEQARKLYSLLKAEFEPSESGTFDRT